jgi:glycosyltransferase involved in cell wall biosynthesis
MRIGFDAKRAYHNSTGLGNYSRTLIESLSNYFPDHDYYLYNPKKTKQSRFHQSNIHEINPSGLLPSMLPSVWRSKWMAQDIIRQVDLYHGLSNELPFGLAKSKIKKVVTIHDLIFETYPEQYHKNDVLIYRKKFKHACEIADAVIAISEHTKQDLIDRYQIQSSKIQVCYQSCHSRFFTSANAEQKKQVTETYALHQPYFLSVGSIIPRKNLLSVCQAFQSIASTTSQNLVVIGQGNNVYKQEILQFLSANELLHRVVFLEDQYPSSSIYKDLPILYQNASALLYPSRMEGFGIPVLEAMASGTPVITSNVSSLIEAGGDAAICIDPNSIEEMAFAMQELINDNTLRQQCIKKGIERAQLFTNKITCEQVMKLYKQIN